MIWFMVGAAVVFAMEMWWLIEDHQPWPSSFRRFWSFRWLFPDSNRTVREEK